MSTAPLLPLMTVEEYDRLPDPAGGFKCELHFGELVKVEQPKRGHYDLQEVICEVLRRRLNRKTWRVGIEMPYGLTPGYDARRTDVGVVLRKVWEAIPKKGDLIGSPVLVVEGKSPSNWNRQMERDAILHITHGACAVWIAKEDARQIVQVTASSRTAHAPGDLITLPVPLSVTIAVDEIFPH